MNKYFTIIFALLFFGSAENWNVNRIIKDDARLHRRMPHEDELGLTLEYAMKIKEMETQKRNVLNRLQDSIKSSENSTVTIQVTKRQFPSTDKSAQNSEYNWRKWLTNTVDKSRIKYIITTFISHGVLSPSYLDPLDDNSLVNMGIDNKDAKNIINKRRLEDWLSDVVLPKDVSLVVRACLQHNLDVSTLRLLSSDSMVENVGIAFGDAIRIYEKAQRGQINRGSSEASIKPSQSIMASDSVESNKKMNGGITLNSMADANKQSFLLADSDGGSTVKVVLSFDNGSKETIKKVTKAKKSTGTKVVEKRKKEPTQEKKIKKGKKTVKNHKTTKRNI